MLRSTPSARPATRDSQSFTLSVPRGTALYIGALLGPGLLLLPGLAARQAGPASIVAWAGLLGVSALFAVVFAALGRAHPQANGVAGYAAAGLGPAAGRVVSWCFLAGVIGGAPVVCLIGAGYVTGVTGGGPLARCAVAAVLLLVVLALALGGVRASSTAQLVLVALLIVIIVVAVTGSAPGARASHWAPFAPHGWSAIGRAAATLMLSFVGWEAVAPLTTRFRDPDRQLPRVIGTAFAVTAVLYLALAVATIAVLGPAAGTDVPLASLLARAVGTAGPVAAAVAAVVLTLGAVNAYLSGAAAMARQLAGGGRGAGNRPILAASALVGLVVIGLYAAHLVGTAQLIGLPTTLFLVVYLGCTVSAARILRGKGRAAAATAALAVVVVLAFCGWPLVLAATVAAAAALTGRRLHMRAGDVDGGPGAQVDDVAFTQRHGHPGRDLAPVDQRAVLGTGVDDRQPAVVPRHQHRMQAGHPGVSGRPGQVDLRLDAPGHAATADAHLPAAEPEPATRTVDREPQGGRVLAAQRHHLIEVGAVGAHLGHPGGQRGRAGAGFEVVPADLAELPGPAGGAARARLSGRRRLRHVGPGRTGGL
jgi:amino acid efflux transporter